MGTHEDVRAIQGLITEMTAAFNSHDAAATSRMYRPDAEFVTVRGERFSGKPDIQRRLADIFATRASRATLKTLDVKIRLIRPDVAIAHVENELTGVTGPAGQPLPAHTEVSIRVFVKEGGEWQVAAFHNTIMGGTPAPQ